MSTSRIDKEIQLKLIELLASAQRLNHSKLGPSSKIIKQYLWNHKI